MAMWSRNVGSLARLLHETCGDRLRYQWSVLALKLKTAHIRDFKWFADLKNHDVSPEAQLVVLLGPIRCGKSLLFDAFQRRLKVGCLFGVNYE